MQRISIKLEVLLLQIHVRPLSFYFETVHK